MLVGLILFVAAAGVHPPEFNPNHPGPALTEGGGVVWRWVHWALLMATALVAVGLASFHHLLGWRADDATGDGGLVRSLAAAAALSSFVIWILLFAFEATGWPVVAAHAGMASVGVMAQALWRALLGTGYVAGALFALAVALWSRAAATAGVVSTWSNACGLLGAVLALVLSPAAWQWPRLALPLLLPGLGLLAVWIAASIRALWSAGRRREPVRSQPTPS